MLITFPISKTEAITATLQKLPENKRAIPLIEKKAAHPAKLNAVNAKTYLNTIKLLLIRCSNYQHVLRYQGQVPNDIS